MTPETVTVTRLEVERGQQLAVIDADVHLQTSPNDPTLQQFIPKRWLEYFGLIGQRGGAVELTLPRQREHSHRLDSEPPAGGVPGSDSVFARQQLLEQYGMRGAILNDLSGLVFKGNGNIPTEMAVAMCQAVNDWHREYWLAEDPRWWANINVPFEMPELAVKEIERCMSLSDRCVQVLFERRPDYPAGHPKYWPIFETCTNYDIPVSFHTGLNRRITACGQPSYYYEDHCDFALSNFNSVSSLIFEGAFDRFPTLKIVLLEANWSWSVPYAWRLDAAWRKLKAEVPHLQRKPSEYVRDHFWYTTQPMEEPENIEEYEQLVELLEQANMGDKLMFSSDYPHWDFDPPFESVPPSLPIEVRRRILGENASKLYKIPLDTNRGVPLDGAAREPL